MTHTQVTFAQATLQLSTDLYEQMAESVAVYDRAGVFLYVNPATERLFGRARYELLGRVIWELFPNAIGNPFYLAFQRVAQTGRFERLEHYYQAWNRWFDNHIYRTGEQVWVIASDITDKKNLERRMEEKSAQMEAERVRLSALFMQAPAYIALLRGPDFVYELSNPMNDAIAGDRALSGLKAREVLPQLGAGDVVSTLEHVYRTGEAVPFHEQQIHIESEPGKRRAYYLSGIFQPTRDEAGAIDGIAHFAFDVTEQVLARKRMAVLAEAGKRFFASLDAESTLHNLASLMVEALADSCMIDVLQPDGSLRQVVLSHRDPDKRALLETIRDRFGLGVSSELRREVMREKRSRLLSGMPPELLTGLQDEHRRLLEQVQTSAIALVPMVVRDRVMGVLSIGAQEPNKTFSSEDLSLFEEIASRAALALEHTRLYREAQEAIAARDDFLSIASHELNTPLTSLILTMEAIHRLVLGFSGQGRRGELELKLKGMRRQLGRIAKLVAELLDVSRITSGRLRLELEEVDLAALVREVVARNAEEAEKLGVAIRLDAPPSLLLACDRLRVDQVLQNLLSNALKYGQGRPIDVALAPVPGEVVLKVRDRGIGIAPTHRHRIFQRFERAVGEKSYSGFGLGLWIVKQVLDAMGARIHVESVEGEGSLFEVSLPRAG